MQHRKSWGRRLRWGLGVMSAVLVGVGAPVAGQTAERAPSPAQDEQPDPQSGEPSEDFAGYVGYVGAGGAGASAAPTDPDEPKAEPLGPVGTNSTESQDVPGQVPAAADDSALTASPLPPAPIPAEVEKVESALAEDGTARVIVMMRAATQLEADLSASEIDAQHDGDRRVPRRAPGHAQGHGLAEDAGADGRAVSGLRGDARPDSTRFWPTRVWRP